MRTKCAESVYSPVPESQFAHGCAAFLLSLSELLVELQGHIQDSNILCVCVGG